MLIEKTIKFEVAEADAPEKMSWPDAIKYAASLGDGWSLPTKEEAALIFENKYKISGINPEEWYWTSTEYNNNYAWIQRFSDGYQYYSNKNNLLSVRCVRR